MKRNSVRATRRLLLATVLIGVGTPGGATPALASPGAALSFAPASSYPVASYPYDVQAGDLNGDSQPDLVVANTHSDTVSVLLAGADGTFNDAGNFAVGAGPQTAALGDFSGDGRLDVAVASAFSSEVHVLRGNGSGGFDVATRTVLPTPGYPKFIKSADLNADGQPDMVVSNVFNDDLRVFLNQGGSFTTSTSTSFPVGEAPEGLALGDLNGDGKLDAALPVNSAVAVLFGDGSGSFGPATAFPAGVGRPSNIAVRDLDGDGRLDVVVGSLTAEGAMLFGAQGGSLEAPVLLATPRSERVVIEDLNFDGYPDIASAVFTGVVTVHLGEGGRQFGAGVAFAAGGGTTAVTAADLDADGRLDLAAVNSGPGTVSVLLNTTPRLDTPSLAGMGDSYAAGYGLGREHAGALKTYPRLAAQRLGWVGHNLAEIGATTVDILRPGGQLGKLRDLALTPDAVTISVGGNDIGFAACAMDLIELFDAGSSDKACADAAFTARVNQFKANLTEVLVQTADAAPGARTFLMTYPDVLSNSSVCVTRAVRLMAGRDAGAAAMIQLLRSLSELSNRLSATLKKAIREAAGGQSTVTVLDVEAASRTRGMCTAPETQWVFTPRVEQGGANRLPDGLDCPAPPDIEQEEPRSLGNSGATLTINCWPHLTPSGQAAFADYVVAAVQDRPLPTPRPAPPRPAG